MRSRIVRLATVKPFAVALAHGNVGAVGVLHPSEVMSYGSTLLVSLNVYTPFLLNLTVKTTFPPLVVFFFALTLPVRETVAPPRTKP